MFQPYIGISAVMSQEEARAALSWLPEGTKRRLMIGTVCSTKTLRGRRNSIPTRFPSIKEMADIFPDDPRALNLIHHNSKTDTGLFDELVAVFKVGGPHLSGLQLNMVWPEPYIIRRFRQKHPGCVIVLQVDDKALQRAEYSGHLLCMRLLEYRDSIDAILLDQSRGYGKPMDTQLFLDLLNEIREVLPSLGVTVCGGLGPDTLEPVRKIAAAFPDVSVDAEANLRDAEDALDLTHVRTYLRQSLALLEGVSV